MRRIDVSDEHVVFSLVYSKCGLVGGVSRSRLYSETLLLARPSRCQGFDPRKPPSSLSIILHPAKVPCRDMFTCRALSRPCLQRKVSTRRLHAFVNFCNSLNIVPESRRETISPCTIAETVASLSASE